MYRLKYLGALAASAALLAGVVPAGAHAADSCQPTPESKTPPNPIVFVHGWPAGASEETRKGYWDDFRESLCADGYQEQTAMVTYGGITPNKVTAHKVEKEVEFLHGKTGKPVDIVTHSMGGVSSRWYLKKLGGATSGKVRKWVSIGGPNLGLDIQFCAVLVGFPCTELLPGGPFMKMLNHPDPTPGDVEYLTIRSKDGTVPLRGDWDGLVPNQFTSLNCKNSRGQLTNLKVKGIGHNAMIKNNEVYGLVRDWLVDSSEDRWGPCKSDPPPHCTIIPGVNLCRGITLPKPPEITVDCGPVRRAFRIC